MTSCLCYDPKTQLWNKLLKLSKILFQKRKQSVQELAPRYMPY